VPEQHGDPIRQQGSDGVERVFAARGGDGQAEATELFGERLRWGQVGLGQTQDGC
jgi:hypothetical protein